MQPREGGSRRVAGAVIAFRTHGTRARRGAGRCAARVAGLVLLVGAAPGCFSERSFAIRPGDFRRDPEVASLRESGAGASEWLERAHARLRSLLPDNGRDALLNRDLRLADGRVVDVHAHFGLPDNLHSLWNNWRGLQNSAQVTGAVGESGRPPPWPGFQEIWIPVAEGLELAGRLGLARRGGRPIHTHCVVLLPGLLGDNGLERTRNLAAALRGAGLHALALEPRGFGRTAERYPDVYYTYGVYDAGDLLAVSEWLQQQPCVKETGLVGFSWSANVALLAAWEDGRPADDPLVPRRLRARLRPHSTAPHFRAGILAVSPVVRFEPLLDRLERDWSVLANPVLHFLQVGVRERRENRGFLGDSLSLRELIEAESRRAGFDYPGSQQDGYDYLRLLPYRGRAAGPKLDRVRAPVLILQAANDPLESAQAIADLLAGVHNPNVAGLILPGGGHNGFPAYCRAYFYSLVLHYFGAPGEHVTYCTPRVNMGVARGPGAAARRARASERAEALTSAEP